MVYKFKCYSKKCGVTHEQSIPAKDFDSSKDAVCPKCKGVAKYVFDGGPAVMTSGMSQPSFDVVIGRDAEKRWENINQRQAKRDKVRKESGQAGLTATGVEEYKPISLGRKRVRTDVRDAVDRDGFRATED